MTRIGILSLLFPLLSAGQGDPPFIVEPGWRPLFNGRDLAGWHTRSSKNTVFQWVSTRGVIWDGAKRPDAFSVLPDPGDRVVNPAGRTWDLVTDEKFGDIELYVEFMVARGSNSGVYLNGHYEVQIRDSYGVADATFDDCGGIHKRAREGFGGTAPHPHVAREAGEWQWFHIWFRGPRFDASGRKTANARVLRVIHNGAVVQRDVEVDGPTVQGLSIPEASQNPLMLQGDHGPVAFRNLYVRALASEAP